MASNGMMQRAACFSHGGPDCMSATAQQACRRSVDTHQEALFYLIQTPNFWQMVVENVIIHGLGAHGIHSFNGDIGLYAFSA